MKQLGIDYAVTWVDERKASAEYYASRRDLFSRAGIVLYGLNNRSVHNQAAIVLGLADRDKKIEQYKQHLRDLSAAGIGYTTYAHMANGIWSSERALTRGGAETRSFDTRTAVGVWAQENFPGGLSHGRRYDQDELWQNFSMFMDEVRPLVEQLDVKIGIHPDDPPGLDLGGVPRCLFSSVAGYEKALKIAASPKIGVCLCVGCWLEGGESMGANPYDALRRFASNGSLFKVHVRNVSQPIPQFTETFIDDGYGDMYRVVRVLAESGFEGIVIPDHVPSMMGDTRLSTAYTMGYLKALIAAACRQPETPNHAKAGFGHNEPRGHDR